MSHPVIIHTYISSHMAVCMCHLQLRSFLCSWQQLLTQQTGSGTTLLVWICFPKAVALAQAAIRSIHDLVQARTASQASSGSAESGRQNHLTSHSHACMEDMHFSTGLFPMKGLEVSAYLLFLLPTPPSACPWALPWL